MDSGTQNNEESCRDIVPQTSASSAEPEIEHVVHDRMLGANRDADSTEEQLLRVALARGSNLCDEEEARYQQSGKLIEDTQKVQGDRLRFWHEYDIRLEKAQYQIGEIKDLLSEHDVDNDVTEELLALPDDSEFLALEDVTDRQDAIQHESDAIKDKTLQLRKDLEATDSQSSVYTDIIAATAALSCKPAQRAALTADTTACAETGSLTRSDHHQEERSVAGRTSAYEKLRNLPVVKKLGGWLGKSSGSSKDDTERSLLITEKKVAHSKEDFGCHTAKFTELYTQCQKARDKLVSCIKACQRIDYPAAEKLGEHRDDAIGGNASGQHEDVRSAADELFKCIEAARDEIQKGKQSSKEHLRAAH